VRAQRTGPRIGERSLSAARGATIAFFVATSLLPYVWFAAASFKTPVDITAVPPRLWSTWTLDAFRSTIIGHGLFRYLWNSLVVAGATTVLTLLVFPQVATAGPIWRLLRFVGLLNTLPGLVLPHVSLGLPLALWLLASFFRELPVDLEEAALVDGANRLTVLTRVVAPLAAPAVFTAAILVFINSWNEFFFALLVLSDPARQTLPLGIALFPGQFTMPWGEIAAASLAATLPLVALVLLLQRRIVSGLVAGALKG
jgi:multiple sugar transport system permease protein